MVLGKHGSEYAVTKYGFGSDLIADSMWKASGRKDRGNIVFKSCNGYFKIVYKDYTHFDMLNKDSYKNVYKTQDGFIEILNNNLEYTYLFKPSSTVGGYSVIKIHSRDKIKSNKTLVYSYDLFKNDLDSEIHNVFLYRNKFKLLFGDTYCTMLWEILLNIVQHNLSTGYSEEELVEKIDNAKYVLIKDEFGYCLRILEFTDTNVPDREIIDGNFNRLTSLNDDTGVYGVFTTYDNRKFNVSKCSDAVEIL